MNDYLSKRLAHINSGRPLPEKKIKYIRKVSLKRQAKLDEQKKLDVATKGKGVKTELDLWFEARRSEMTGKCLFCGGKTEKYNDETFKRSIAHLLPKRKKMFPSIATNPDNWLELCFYSNSCHTNFDNGMITWDFLKDSKEWEIIVTKFRKMYPNIAEIERKNIPEQLLKTLPL